MASRRPRILLYAAFFLCFFAAPALAQGLISPSDDSQNTSLDLIIDDRPTGTLVVDSTVGGYMFRLSDMARAGMWEHSVPESEQLQLKLRDTLYLFDAPKQRLSIDGTPMRVDRAHMTAIDGDVWVDASWLATVLPLRIHVSEKNQTVDVHVFKLGESGVFLGLLKSIAAPVAGVISGELDAPTATNTAPPTLATPEPSPPARTPALEPLASDLAEAAAAPEAIATSSPPPKESPEDKDAIAAASLSTVATKKSCPALITTSPNEDDVLVLEVALDKLVYDELIDGYRIGKAHFIALEQLANALSFPITWDDKAGEATGWFISEKNHIQLSTKDCSLTVDGETVELKKASLLHKDGVLYVRSTVLTEWFPLEIDVNESISRVAVIPLETLPIQQKQERALERQRWQQSNKPAESYPVIEPAYSIGQLPFMYIAADLTSTNAAGAQAIGENLTIFGSSDLDPFNLQTASTSDRDGMISMRMKAQRIDRENKLFGIDGVSALAVGDVESLATELLTGAGVGRGVYISTVPVERRREFDTITLTGDIPANWEVELYNNDALISFVISGPDNRYVFEDVKLFAGDNVIKLVFYGPNGEIREEEKRVSLADRMLPAGEFTQEFSAQEQGVNTFSFMEREDPIEKSLQAIWRGEYGVTDRLTGFTEFATIDLDDGAHQYVSQGAIASIGSVLMQANAAYDASNGGTAFTTQASTSLWDQSLGARHLVLDNFSSGTMNQNLSALKNDSSVDVSGHMPFFISSGLGYVFSGGHQDYVDGREVWTASNRLSTNLFGTNLTHDVSHVETISNGNSSEQLVGSASLRGLMRGVLWRLNGQYSMRPESTFDSINLSLSNRLSSTLTGRLDMRHDFFAQKISAFGATVNWDAGAFYLNTNADINSDGTFTIGLGISTSLYWEPRTSGWGITSERIADQGLVSATAYMDENYNMVQDKGEKRIKDAVFRRGNREVTTNEDGIAIITGIDTLSGTDVVLLEEDLADAYWTAPQPGYHVIARPGTRMLLDFPVHDSSEIEGNIWLNPPEGESDALVKTITPLTGQKPVDPTEPGEGGEVVALPGEALGGSGMTVLLLDAKGDRKAETKSEYDGYYSFSKIIPGRYILTMDASELKPYSVDVAPMIEIEVTRGGDIVVQDINIDIPAKKELAEHAANEPEKVGDHAIE